MLSSGASNETSHLFITLVRRAAGGALCNSDGVFHFRRFCTFLGVTALTDRPKRDLQTKPACLIQVAERATAELAQYVFFPPEAPVLREMFKSALRLAPLMPDEHHWALAACFALRWCWTARLQFYMYRCFSLPV
mmetsp:Transcript_101128/g.325765  ORF Transcript_101128/g.325765 Transcript_101128/m.325765 type:complete len:135 (+) Transcript_101128:1143-1547(+)